MSIYARLKRKMRSNMFKLHSFPTNLSQLNWSQKKCLFKPKGQTCNLHSIIKRTIITNWMKVKWKCKEMFKLNISYKRRVNELIMLFDISTIQKKIINELAAQETFFFRFWSWHFELWRHFDQEIVKSLIVVCKVELKLYLCLACELIFRSFKKIIKKRLKFMALGWV